MKICVFGASSSEIEKKYVEAGERLGAEIAKRGHKLVFGGGASGLMGAAVRGVDEENGYSIGIAPRFFDEPGVLYENCSEFIFTETMGERKGMMEAMADAFILTPGSIGTLEEFFEVYTLKQLGQHNKPIGILNTDGYYDQMIILLNRIVEKKFMEKECLDMICVSKDPSELMDILLKDKE